jgi:Flp pilus assembly pilin Flp
MPLPSSIREAKPAAGDTSPAVLPAAPGHPSAGSRNAEGSGSAPLPSRPPSEMGPDGRGVARALSGAGQGLVEYALLLALVALVAVAGLTLVGHRTSNVYSSVSNGLRGSGAPASPSVKPTPTTPPRPTATPRPHATPRPAKTPRPPKTPRPRKTPRPPKTPRPT